MIKVGHPPPKAVVFHDNETVIVPPRAIRMFDERECECPLGEEGGGVALSRDAKEIKIRAREGTCKEMIWKGCDVSVIGGAIGIVRAAREGVGAISGAWFMDKDEVVVAKRKDVTGDAAVDMLGGAVILKILVVGDDSDTVGGAHKEVAPVF